MDVMSFIAGVGSILFMEFLMLVLLIAIERKK